MEVVHGKLLKRLIPANLQGKLGKKQWMSAKPS
jgi:hypothetical protein